MCATWDLDVLWFIPAYVYRFLYSISLRRLNCNVRYLREVSTVTIQSYVRQLGRIGARRIHGIGWLSKHDGQTWYFPAS